jgi:hypothetical protein
LALSKLEHYGLVIIDAYSLFTIPLYNNEEGLTEAVYGDGKPIIIDKKDIQLAKSTRLQ